MKDFFMKTFGGLTPSFYFKNILVAGLFSYMIYWLSTQSNSGISTNLKFFLILNTLLYPYSRFIWKEIKNFFMGENIFILPIIFIFFMKTMTIAICYSFAIFIAPIGLIYLYIIHSRNQ